MAKKIRAACLYLIALVLGVAASVGDIHSKPLFWTCIGIAVVSAIVGTCSLVYSGSSERKPKTGSITQESHGPDSPNVVGDNNRIN
jgi:hypothetical protein